MVSKRLIYAKLLLITITLITIKSNIILRFNVKDLVSLNSNSNANKTNSNLIKSFANFDVSYQPSRRRLPQANFDVSYPSIRRRLPQAIIIGVNKGGTNALVKMMTMHSKIVGFGSEPHFFDKFYDRGLEWYRQQMPPSEADQLTLEKTPGYFRNEKMNISIPLRIHSMNSSIRLILIVRDPVIRSISNYLENVETGKRHQVSFEEAFIHSNGTVKYEEREISNSLYAPKFKLYLEVFPREQILVLDGDQMIVDPLPILQKVERFLNLEPEITKENLYFNKAKGFYCVKINGSKTCLGKEKGREHPEVNKEVLRKLRLYFAPYNQRFYDLVGHDFGWATS